LPPAPENERKGSAVGFAVLDRRKVVEVPLDAFGELVPIRANNLEL
jgi:hypothetical protein